MKRIEWNDCSRKVTIGDYDKNGWGHNGDPNQIACHMWWAEEKEVERQKEQKKQVEGAHSQPACVLMRWSQKREPSRRNGREEERQSWGGEKAEDDKIQSTTGDFSNDKKKTPSIWFYF